MSEGRQKDQKVSHQLAKLEWKNKAISAYNPDTNKRLTVPFGLSGNLKGLHLRFYPSTKSKTFVLIGRFENKVFYHKCGVFQEGKTGTIEIEKYLSGIADKHKDHDGNWTSNPNAENVTDEEIKESIRYRVREGIQKLHQEGYPKVEYEGSIAEKSIRTYTQYHSGYNERRKLLTFGTDENGYGVVKLKEGNWDWYWNKFKPYQNCTREDEKSIYDSKIGAYYFDQLTPEVVENWCNKGSTYGARVNRLKAIQYLYSACGKLKLTPRNQMDPTRQKYNGVKLNKSKLKKSKVSKYNNISFSVDQLHRIEETLWTLRDDYPFQTEAVLLMLHTGRRETETLKLTVDNLYKHNGKYHKDIITMPGNITKKRSEEYIVITEGVQKVLDSLEYQRAKTKFQKYKHIKSLFPKKSIDPLLCADVHWCKTKTEEIRYRNIETVWKKVVELTGVDGQKKTFRKTLATIGTKVVGADKTIQITGHEDTKILLKNYNKPLIEDKIETAQEIAKVYNIKK